MLVEERSCLAHDRDLLPVTTHTTPHHATSYAPRLPLCSSRIALPWLLDQLFPNFLHGWIFIFSKQVKGTRGASFVGLSMAHLSHFSLKLSIFSFCYVNRLGWVMLCIIFPQLLNFSLNTCFHFNGGHAWFYTLEENW